MTPAEHNADRWQYQPQAIALFDRAFAICGDGVAQFPYAIEAQLEALADGEDVIAAWDRYCVLREVACIVAAENAVAADLVSA